MHRLHNFVEYAPRLLFAHPEVFTALDVDLNESLHLTKRSARLIGTQVVVIFRDERYEFLSCRIPTL